ncbi:tRNA lysidine(34) synthetase TilS [Chryseobacterium limigenitum]|uniref:tRNA(Ile)-lysidine synthase n=1 Tax=Chryseobacterium limigenitum TaxID=1612149 RepID=A0A1K2ITJ2_9FLAO|nr:tRNA lysidine(34) synthetase TilS [Chryseobacterium limigenitum]SFZ95773.1 tRNA(Ile)-lysidine synthase [Chryseobacterium limigenitum]
MLDYLSFKNQLKNLIESPENHSYLLAVSGGADSMVLASLFLNSGIKFQVAHINYKLRGEDSDLDQKVVQDFCEKNHIPFHLYEVSEKDNKPENSIQLWARELRYNFFKQIQQQEKLEFLVTAHHLNDQLETFIINLSKASGINGLSGIPPNDNNILRPLLQFSKEEIYEFAKKNSIEFREDLSNKKSDYLRNKIRNEIVPKLLETNDHFLENFGKSSSYLNQTKDFVQNQIKEIENRLSTFNKDHKILSKEKLNEESDFVKFEILKKYGFNQEEEISKIFKAENGSSFFSKEYQLIINRNELIFSKLKLSDILNEKPEEIILNINENHEIILPESLELKISTAESFEWLLDIEKISLPVKLRKKKEGDVFFPIGMKGKKKISKFLRDEKLSFFEKENTWLLCDAKDQILGILPYRQDGRFSAGKHTKKILKIKWTEKQQII